MERLIKALQILSPYAIEGELPYFDENFDYIIEINSKQVSEEDMAKLKALNVMPEGFWFVFK